MSLTCEVGNINITLLLSYDKQNFLSLWQLAAKEDFLSGLRCHQIKHYWCAFYDNKKIMKSFLGVFWWECLAEMTQILFHLENVNCQSLKGLLSSSFVRIVLILGRDERKMTFIKNKLKTHWDNFWPESILYFLIIRPKESVSQEYLHILSLSLKILLLQKVFYC